MPYFGYLTYAFVIFLFTGQVSPSAAAETVEEDKENMVKVLKLH